MADSVLDFKEHDTNEGYQYLYIAIWIQAIKDDIRHISKKLLYRTSLDLFPYLLGYDEDKRDTFGKIECKIRAHGQSGDITRFKRFEAAFDGFRPILDDIIRHDIYREAQRWPSRHINQAFSQALEKMKIRLADLYKGVV